MASKYPDCDPNMDWESSSVTESEEDLNLEGKQCYEIPSKIDNLDKFPIFIFPFLSMDWVYKVVLWNTCCFSLENTLFETVWGSSVKEKWKHAFELKNWKLKKNL